jgi:hypothetical protein
LAAALAAAAFLPGEPLGAGVLLVAVLVGATVAQAARPTFEGALFGALALALAAVPTLRDATWVVAIDLGAAALLGAAAVSGAIPAALLAPLVRARDLVSLAPPPPAALAPALRDVALAGLVVVPFGALFWTADAAFAGLSQMIPFPSPASIPGRALAFAAVFFVAAGLAIAARRPLPVALRLAPTRRLGPWEWGIPLALLDALFLAFVAVQLAVLFGGHEHVLKTTGLTYAEYARSGFWQLLGAAGLTLAVIGAAVLVAETPRRFQRLLLRAALGLLCALTIVVLVSALRRMLLYEDAFGLTRPRLLAEAVALWLGGLFALVGAAGLVPFVRRHLSRIAVAGTGAALLAFSLADPDRLVAAHNVARWRDSGRLDLPYLQELSADAARERARALLPSTDAAART